ncbi:hypothetical protein MettiDRAFT_2631 [Methanolobus tindarius DSM 2278]|uniref:Uncharacterized protein n=1 Tax=Methanolobus tindarius DSM 2278 TaxID=1090322 RepID=W9DZM4_METTI|nr:hypothetical protein [Methanolobus tindarius]ETA69137.1 hypothetical protein MettiDRAFT_2631 [Methanolobus tindarius DSM 2278]
MRKPFLRTEIKRAIIEPETDMDEVCIVPEMPMQYINNAVITVSEDGYAFVTWLQPVKDWKYHVADFIGGCLVVALFFAACTIFWSSRISLLQNLGVI